MDNVMQPGGMQLIHHSIIGSWELVRTNNIPPGCMVSDITRFNADGTGAGVFHQDNQTVPFDWRMLRPGWIYISGSGEIEYEISGDYARFIFGRAANFYSVVRRMVNFGTGQIQQPTAPQPATTVSEWAR